MKKVIERRPNIRKSVMRDAHDPERIYVKLETNETPVIERNKAIRSAELLKQDSRNIFHEGDVIAFAFQFPTFYDYARVKRLEPELFARCEQGGDDGLRAAERLAILYPQYVTTTKRGDRRAR